MRFADRRAGALFLAAAILCAPLAGRAVPRFSAESSGAPAEAAAERAPVAVLVTQSVGVGPLADHLGELAADSIASRGHAVLRPGEAATSLRGAGPDPLTCGSDAACLGEAGRALQVRWVVAVGLGKFGEMYGLDVRLVDREGGEPQSSSATYAAPGPDWEEAIGGALRKLLPPELQEPAPAEVEVASNVDGAELLVDGVPAGSTPLAAPLRLAPGAHVLELRKDGHGATREELELAPGGSASVELALAPIASPAAIPMRTWTYASAGASLAALAGAVAFHLDASSTMDDARSRKDDGLSFASQRESALGSLDTARILYGVAGVAAAGAITLFFLDRGAE